MNVWADILLAMCGAGTLGGAITAVVQHLITLWTRKHHPEEDPKVRARTVISRHSALRDLKEIHRDATRRGWISLDDLEEALELYGAYHTLDGNGAGTKIVHDLKQMPNHPHPRSNK